MTLQEGDVMWKPDPVSFGETRLAAFMRWLDEEHGLHFEDYSSIWKWSTRELEAFWRAVWDFFEIVGEGDPKPTLPNRSMPGAQWFPNVRLNYSENVFRFRDPEAPALIARREGQSLRIISWRELEAATAALSASMRVLGVKRGDRVVGYLPNVPETVVAFLACASIGAIWSCCAPEMGVPVVLDRFRQIEPVVLIATDGYTYRQRAVDRRAEVAQLLQGLPTVRHTIQVPTSDPVVTAWPRALLWQDMVRHPEPMHFERVPFTHPLWVVFSSGTTGLPKAIVHGHGGIVLTHLKTAQLQHDLRPGDRMLFLGSTGWIVWNFLVGGLLSGATVVLNDGDPAWPDGEALWRFIGEQKITLFGCGAAYLHQCQKAGIRPGNIADLSSLRLVNSTGSPLSLSAFEWIYECVKPDIWLGSISGGTDVASGIVACAPNLPVHAGEIQCAELGVAACAFDEQGHPVTDKIGELVITEPMPSMPLFFWSDPESDRYREAYFNHYPGVWRQGDWARFTSYGSAILYGRSDTTMNRQGIRIGPGEIYRVLDEMFEIADSLVVDLEFLERPSFMPLFVVPARGVRFDEQLKARICAELRMKASPRHVPNEIYEVQQIPRTLTGKKMELPVRRILLGANLEDVVSPGAMANPESLKFFVELAKCMEHHQYDG